MNSVKSLESKPQIEETLFSMINEGSIKAKIDSKQEMISFIDTTSSTGKGNDDEYLEVIEELEAQNKRIIDLMAQVQQVDTNLQQTDKFIKRTLLGKGSAAAAKDDSVGDMF